MTDTPQLADPAPRKSVLESPWYWIYAFCAAALAGLMLIGPKFYQRQVREENNFAGRTQVMQGSTEQPVPLLAEGADDQGQTRLNLRPLYALLLVVCLAAWGIVWWQHFAKTPPEPHVTKG